MARKVKVLLVDDLDGKELGENGETVAFGWGGERYEIDLSHENAEKLRNTVGEYVKAARNVTRVGNRGSAHGARRSAAGTGGSSAEAKEARAWLIAQGILTPESRGRISADNWEKFRSRNQQSIPASTAKAATAEKPATGGTAETAQTPDKAPRGNSTTPAKAAAKDKGTPSASGVASLLP